MKRKIRVLVIIVVIMESMKRKIRVVVIIVVIRKV